MHMDKINYELTLVNQERNPRQLGKFTSESNSPNFKSIETFVVYAWYDRLFKHKTHSCLHSIQCMPQWDNISR